MQTGREPWSEVITEAAGSSGATAGNAHGQGNVGGDRRRSGPLRDGFCTDPNLERFANVAGAMLFLKGQHQPSAIHDVLRDAGGASIPVPSSPDWDYRYYDDDAVDVFVADNFRDFFLVFKAEDDRNPILKDCGPSENRICCAETFSSQDFSSGGSMGTKTSRSFPVDGSRESSSQAICVPVLTLWNSLSPHTPVVRADLFRYMAIYILGGVYIDQKGGFAYPPEYAPSKPRVRGRQRLTRRERGGSSSTRTTPTNSAQHPSDVSSLGRGPTGSHWSQRASSQTSVRFLEKRTNHAGRAATDNYFYTRTSVDAEGNFGEFVRRLDGSFQQHGPSASRRGVSVSEASTMAPPPLEELVLDTDEFLFANWNDHAYPWLHPLVLWPEHDGDKIFSGGSHNLRRNAAKSDGPGASTKARRRPRAQGKLGTASLFGEISDEPASRAAGPSLMSRQGVELAQWFIASRPRHRLLHAVLQRAFRNIAFFGKNCAASVVAQEFSWLSRVSQGAPISPQGAPRPSPAELKQRPIRPQLWKRAWYGGVNLCHGAAAVLNLVGPGMYTNVLMEEIARDYGWVATPAPEKWLVGTDGMRLEKPTWHYVGSDPAHPTWKESEHSRGIRRFDDPDGSDAGGGRQTSSAVPNRPRLGGLPAGFPLSSERSYSWGRLGSGKDIPEEKRDWRLLCERANKCGLLYFRPCGHVVLDEPGNGSSARSDVANISYRGRGQNGNRAIGDRHPRRPRDVDDLPKGRGTPVAFGRGLSAAATAEAIPFSDSERTIWPKVKGTVFRKGPVSRYYGGGEPLVAGHWRADSLLRKKYGFLAPPLSSSDWAKHTKEWSYYLL